MLRRAATAAAVLLGGVLAPGAHAADGPDGGICEGAALMVTVCASDGSGSGSASGNGSGDAGATPAGASGGRDSKPSCTYTRLDPQPPPDNMYWKGHQGQKGAVYGVNCPGTQGVRTVFIPDGEAPEEDVPQIDPEVVARQAVDSMKLVGPKVASPRPDGRYVVGMPMWMWVEPSATTYGPATASATAGGVTVTATAKVSSIKWDMGDGTTVTCTGPGTRYDASRGKAPSPDCGHLYEVTSTAQRGGKYAGTATATWTVQWTAQGLGDAGEFPEVRETPFTAAVGEVQVLN